MNNLIALVKEIKTSDNLNIVKFDYNGETLSMMSLGLSNDVKIGAKIKLSIKPTNVVVVKDFKGESSCSNQLSAKVIHVQNGELLSSLKLQLHDTTLESIITKDASDKINIHVDDIVTVFIKENELSIVEIL
jgi:molybdopterin-binding protein